jgi:hypothetical protein
MSIDPVDGRTRKGLSLIRTTQRTLFYTFDTSVDGVSTLIDTREVVDNQ